jgi:hypothetical protein
MYLAPLLSVALLCLTGSATVLFDNTAGATNSLTASNLASNYYLVDDVNNFFAFTFAQPAFATSPYAWTAGTFKVGLWRSTNTKSRSFYLEQRCLSSAPPAGLPGTLLASVKTSAASVDGTAGYQSLSTASFVDMSWYSSCPYYAFIIKGFDLGYTSYLQSCNLASDPNNVPASSIVTMSGAYSSSAGINGPWVAGAYGWPAVYLDGTNPTPSATASRSQAPSSSSSSTQTPSQTGSRSQTSSQTNTATPSQTVTASVSTSYSSTRSASTTATASVSTSYSSSSTASITVSISISSTQTASATVSISLSQTATGTATVSTSYSATSTASWTPTNSRTPSNTPSQTGSDTSTISQTQTATISHTASCSQTPSNSPTSTMTPSSSDTGTMTPTASQSAVSDSESW